MTSIPDSLTPYAGPKLAVDCVVFGIDGADQLKLLLIQRQLQPYAGQWALPGGFVRPGESVDCAARRELAEETGVRDLFLEQLYTFGDLHRDPRGQVVSVAYYALVNLRNHHVRAATDAVDARWFAASALPPLAFDHKEIFAVALRRLRGKIRYEPIGFELLPEKFTLTQLQRLYEVILRTPLDKRNFRKKILKTGVLKDLKEKESGVARRAAQLYSFDQQQYQTLKQNGGHFEN